MIRRARKIRIGKRNTPMWLIPRNIPRCRFAVDAEEESRLRIHVGVSPTIEDDSGDVTARIESAGREHVAELLPESTLVLRERSAEQLRTSSASLLSYR